MFLQQLLCTVFRTIFSISLEKATPSDDGLKFECQHGKSECAGNKAHSCGLYLTPNQETAVKFVACAMESRNYEKVTISFE